MQNPLHFYRGDSTIAMFEGKPSSFGRANQFEPQSIQSQQYHGKRRGPPSKVTNIVNYCLSANCALELRAYDVERSPD